MARPEAISIVRHVSLEELNRVLKEAEKNAARASRVRQWLTFIRMRYLGYTVPEAAKAVGITAQTGYNIQERWNAGGPDAVKPKFGGGRPSRLTQEEKNELVELLRVNPMDTSDVRLYIMDRYEVDYTMKQVHVILKGMGLRHAKPYPEDHRRPDDAEEQLKKNSRMLWMPPETTS
jgi:putative transposase